MFKFPYTNFHELNLDWIIERIKMIKTAVTDAAASASSAKTSETNAAASQTAAAESAASAEHYYNTITENVGMLVTGWLNEHVTPTSPVVDSSLSISGAAADAKATGDGLTDLNNAIEKTNINFNNAITHNYSVNLLENVTPTLGYTYSRNATEDYNYSADANGAIYPVINIIEGKTYSYVGIRSYFSSVLYNNESRLEFDNDDGKFTATDNGKLFLSVRRNDIGEAKFYDGDIFIEQGYFVNDLKIYDSDIIKNNIIHVGSTRAIKGFIEAINKSKDGDTVIFDSEDYDIVEELGETWLNNYTYESKGYGFYLGGGKKFIFPYGATVKFHYTGNNAQVHEFFSPINAGQGDFEIIGLHLSARNCRYCVHDERATNDIFYRHTFKNCHFEMDNTGNPDWNSKQCIGGGLGVNGIVNIEDCIFNSVDGTYDVSYHNSQSSLAKSFISIKNSWFENTCRFSWYGDSQRITSILFDGNSIKAPITVSSEGSGSGSPYENILVKQWNNEIRSE